MADQDENPQALLLVIDIPHPQQEKDSLLVPEAEPPSPPFNPLAHQPAKISDDKPEQVSDLPEDYRKALHELKRLVREHDFGAPPATPKPKAEEIKKPEKALLEDDGAKTLEAIEETIVPKAPAEAGGGVFIWGVNLMEDDCAGATDVVLLKFLRARDFRPREALSMLKDTLRWRKEFFGSDGERESLDLDGELGRAVFMHGRSRDGNPVCYNAYGEFRDKELYRKLFSDEEKRERFLRWRVMFLEKSIRGLDLGAAGVSTIVQVNDLKNCPGPFSWELRQATNRALHLLQDNYPEFVAKQVFINVPWWYVAVSKMISPFLTQRSKAKFVVAGPSTSTDTLLKLISAEQIPRQYGGLSREEDEGDFGVADNVTEVVVKPSSKHTVEFLVSGTGSVSWEVKVVGWEVGYGAEFVPSAEEAYTVILQKSRKIGSTQEQVICGSYKVGEPGKLVLTVDNLVARKKKLFYRFKTKLSDD